MASRDLTLFFAWCALQFSIRAERSQIVQLNWRTKNPGYAKSWADNNRDKVRIACKKWRTANPEKCKAQKKQSDSRSYQKNKEARLLSSKQYYLGNTEIVKKKVREYALANRDKIRIQRKDYKKNRALVDIHFKLGERLRHRTYLALKGFVKSKRTFDLLGCSIPELRQYLEKQFQPGMTWENYGPVWHVDHIRPCASYDFTDSTQQKQCFHFSNRQPLLAADNIRKGAKYGDGQ